MDVKELFLIYDGSIVAKLDRNKRSIFCIEYCTKRSAFRKQAVEDQKRTHIYPVWYLTCPFFPSDAADDLDTPCQWNCCAAFQPDSRNFRPRIRDRLFTEVIEEISTFLVGLLVSLLSGGLPRFAP